MNKKKRKFKIWKIAVPAAFLIALFLGFEHFRLKGLENSLISLVDQKTNGNYRLVIEDSEINYTDLSMHIKNAVIVRTAGNQTPGGIDRVEIPDVFLNVGSLFSLLFNQQLIIENFRITEPVVSLTSEKKEETEKKPLNLAHEVTRMYPVVEAILDKFDIRSFQVMRADLDIALPESSQVTSGTVKLGLISLLIYNWDMKNLDEQSSLRLILEKQQLRIVRSRLAFDRIEYDYHAHALEIHNLSLQQYDTLGRLAFEMDEADLFIHQMDFEALYNDEAYILEDLRIDSARLTAHVYPHDPVPEEKKDRMPVSHLLKDNFGTMQLANGGLVNSTIDFVLYKPEDTLALTIPNLSIRTTEFGVSPDSSTLTFSDFIVEASGIDVELEGLYNIRIGRLFYKDGIDLTLDSIQVREAPITDNIVHCEQIELYSFSVFNLLYSSLIQADSLVLRNGNVYFNKFGRLDAPPSNGANARQANSSVDLDKLIFDHVDAIIDFGDRKVEVRGMEAQADNFIRTPDTASYELQYLRTRYTRYSDQTADIDIVAREMNFKPLQLRLASVQGNYSTLNVAIKGLFASPKNFAIGRPFYYEWNTININDLHVTGELPKPRQQPNQGGAPLSLAIEEAGIDNLQISVSNGENSYGLTGGEFHLRGIGISPSAINLPEVSARFEAFTLDSRDSRVTLGNTSINSMGISEFSNLSVVTPTTTITIPEIQTGPLAYSDSSFFINHSRFSSVSLSQPASDQHSKIDSIVLTDLSWNKQAGPHVEKVRVFSPQIHLFSNKNGNKEKPADATRIAPFKYVNEIDLSPGVVSIDEKKIEFGNIRIVKGSEHLDFSLTDLSFDTGKGVLSVESVNSASDNILVDNFRFQADEEFVRNMELENDVFDGVARSIEISDVVWDSLYEKNMLQASSVVINGADFVIRRDKRLPDPPFKRKPFLVGEWIPHSGSVQIPLLKIQNTNITYKEIGEKTGSQGSVTVNDINGEVHLARNITEPEQVLQATAKLYDTGNLTAAYARIDSSRFSLNVRLTDMPAPLLNQMVDSLEAIKLKSGMIREFDMTITGTDSLATGNTIITYEDLHIEIFKKGSPEVRNLGSELLTLLADGIILKHSKTDAIGTVNQVRFREKGPINYWVKSAIHGAMDAIRKGTDQKTESRKKRRKKDRS